MNLKNILLVSSTILITSCIDIPSSDKASNVDLDMKKIDSTSEKFAIGYRDSVVIPEIEKFEPYRIKKQYIDPFMFKFFAYEAKEEEKTEEDCDSPENDCGVPPDNSRKKELLEQYQLAELAYVGSMTKTGSNKKVALLKTPDIGVVRVTIGKYIGKNDGIILQIKPRYLVISEKVKQGVVWKDQRRNLLIVK